MPSNNNSGCNGKTYKTNFLGLILKKLLDTRMVAALKTLKAHCCYLRASVGIGMAILPLKGIYPQIKMAKVLFKTKTNNLPSIFNSIFQTGRQCL